MKDKKKVLLVNGSRTPIGSFGRSLKSVGVDKLAGHAIAQALRRAGVSPAQVDGLILGHAFQSSLTPNLARFVWDKTLGYPVHVPGYTVQIQCGSGMKAINLAMDEIQLGHGDIYVAGGAESMSTIPYLVPGALRFTGMLSRWFKFGPRPHFGLAEDGLVPRALLWDTRTTFMAATAQRLANAYGISRQAQDEYALRSQQLAAAAAKSGRLADEIDPIATKSGYMERDEHPRSTSLEKLSALPGVLKQKDITAGNSSGINDGGCAVVLASEDAVARLGLTPLVECVDHVVVGVDPEEMGLGPAIAIPKLLARNGLTLADIGAFEINEAFASQTLTCLKLLGVDPAKVNANGGAIALGHPIAMSGARITLSLAHEMKRRGVKYGIASLCIGGGQGVATLLKLVD